MNSRFKYKYHASEVELKHSKRARSEIRPTFGTSSLKKKCAQGSEEEKSLKKASKKILY